MALAGCGRGLGGPLVDRAELLRLLRPLSWATFLIAIVLVLFSSEAARLIGLNIDFDCVLETKAEFASVFWAVRSLFCIMTLDDWVELVDPLFRRAGWCYLFFFAFVCVAVLALENLVATVGVEISVKRTQHDGGLPAAALRRRRRSGGRRDHLALRGVGRRTKGRQQGSAPLSAGRSCRR